MENKHTPGPWEFFYKHKYDEWHVSVPLSGQTTRLGLFPYGCPTENAEADARLIAAAPDLLEALSEVIGLIDEGWLVRNIDKDHEPGFAMRMLEPVKKLAHARAAIAKAEGKNCGK